MRNLWLCFRKKRIFAVTNEYPVTALRFWSGEFFEQEASTPAPHRRPYRLVNVPFYYIGQLQEILNRFM